MSAIVVGIFAVALANCGGNGGSTSTPVNTSFRPAAGGDAFAYAGTMTEQFVRAPVGAGEITPSPNPINSQTLTYAVSQAVSVSKGSFQSVAPSPFDFHVVETDNLNGGLETSTVTSDDYYSYTVSGAATTIGFAGSNVSTSTGSTFTTVIGSGNGLVDILPEVAGALSPTNNAAETISETDADTSTDVKTVNADGTYTENGTSPDGTTTTAVVNADGSGSYTFPIIIPTDSAYSVSAPASGNITITASFAPALLEGGPEPAPITVAVWYPLPLVLSQETLVDNGASTLPAACKVSGVLAKTPHQLVDTKSTVDPVFGELETTTTTTYTERGIGVACIQLSDVLNLYYDISGQSQFTLNFSSTPLQTTTTTETLGITAATVLGLTAVERGSEAALRAGVSRFEAELTRRRVERRKAFSSALAARLKIKGGHL